MIQSILCALLILLITYFTFRYYWNCYVSPPGPWGIPYFGLLPCLLWFEFKNNWKGQYKSITLYRHSLGQYYSSLSGRGLWSSCMGEQRVTFLHTYDAAKEALVDNASNFSDRPEADAYQRIAKRKGIIFSNGSLWNVHRKFSLTTLRSLGVGKSALEKRITEEVYKLNQFIHQKTLEDNEKRGLNTSKMVVRGVTNVICQLVFGRRYDYDDPTLDRWQQMVQNIVQIKGLSPILEFFYPTLSKYGILRFLRGTGDPVISNFNLVRDEVMKLVEEIQTLYCPGDQPTNYIEAFLQRRNSGIDCEQFSLDQLISSSVDLFIAGMDTTTNAVAWILLFLSIHPHYQMRMQEEIDGILPDREDIVTMSLRSYMPFTCAVIDEGLRHGSIVPFSVDRRVRQDCHIRGYRIHNDDVIMTNLYGIHHDPNFWEDPMNFAPEKHFMDKETESIYETSKYLNPFGMGSRQCLGENIARTEIFLFVTNFMKNFTLTLKMEDQYKLEEILMGKDGLVRSPGDHRILFTPRN